MRRLATPLLLAAAMLLTLVAPAHASGLPSHRRWLADTRAAMAGSRAWIDARPAAEGEKLAINLDIDNTSLQTRYRSTRRAVPAVLRFTRYASEHGVAVFFNTGRAGSLDGITARLKKAGYRVDGICGRKSGETLTTSKQRCRQQYTDAGFTIIANVGNRSTDFVGGNYEKAFKLPDYGNRLS